MIVQDLRQRACRQRHGGENQRDAHVGHGVLGRNAEQQLLNYYE
jgi:hypothetical protein